jgi:hypothetical protein
MRWLWHLGQFVDMMALLIEITAEASTRAHKNWRVDLWKHFET